MATMWMCSCATTRRPDDAPCDRCGPRCLSLNGLDEGRCHRCGKRRPYSLLTPGRLVTLALIFVVALAWLAGETGLLIVGIPAHVLVIALASALVLLVAGVFGLVWVSFALWRGLEARRYGYWLPFVVAVVGSVPLLVGAWWAVATLPDEPVVDSAAVRAWLWVSIAWLVVGIPLTGLTCRVTSTMLGSTSRGFTAGLAGILVMAIAVVVSAAAAGRFEASPIPDPLIAAGVIALIVACPFAFGFIALGLLYMRIIYSIVPPSD